MSGENSIPVYEFSKGFRDIQYNDKSNKWESGGFLKDIDRYNYPVPQEIESAVKQGYFRINDNYPPAIDDFALIARDIDQYSVLAVATKIPDDRVRNLIAYRYFWLKRCEVEIPGDVTELDGIGSLLLWWYSAGQRKYSFDENENAPVDLQKYPLRLKIAKDFDSYYREIEHFFNKIKYIPHVEIADKNTQSTKPNPFAWHYFVLSIEKEYKLKERSRKSLAWAWNVGWLEHPETFTLILNAEKGEAYNHNYSEAQKHKADLRSLQPVAPANHSGNYGGQMVRGGGLPLSVSHKNPTLTNKIKQCLTSLSASDKPDKYKLLDLVNYLEQSSSNNWEWDTIDTVRKKENPSVGDARYKALLAILKPGEVPEWLSWLSEQNNRGSEIPFLSMIGLNKDDFEKASLTIQQQLIKESENSKSANNQLKNNIDDGIYQLLLEYTQTNSSFKEYKNKIEWLLVDSGSFWSYSFSNYAQYLATALDRRQSSDYDKFHQKVLETIRQWETYKQTYNKEQKFSEYKTLAELFKSTHKSLSALFYQLSEGSVPSDIHDKIEVRIIPFIRSVNPSSSANEDNWFSFLPNNKIGIAILVLILTIIAAAIGAVFPGGGNKGGKQPPPPNPIVTSSLENEIFHQQESGEITQKSRDKTIEFLIKLIQSINKASTDKDEAKRLSKDATYNFIKKKFITIPQIMPIKAGGSSDDIIVLQEILISQGFSNVEKTGQFDDVTKQAVILFQKNNQFKQTGSVENQTWEALSEMPKQVKVAAIFLQQGYLNPSAKYADIHKEIDNLDNKCKAKLKPAKVYIDCVNNLMTPPTPPPTPSETPPPTSGNPQTKIYFTYKNPR